MPAQSSTTSPKDDPMQIDTIRFKPFTEHEKQRRHTNNVCLHCGEPSHIVHECPKNNGPHVADAISITNPQLK
jgi:hypothetical protein